MGTAKDWLISYLHDRQQFVSINGCNSELSHIPCGVPERSVLGPLLFLLYINDFQNCSLLFDYHFFADDTNLFYSDTSLKAHLERKVNENLKSINSWLKANRLILNVDKSNFIIFHPPQKSLSCNIKLFINQEPKNVLSI